MDVVHNEWQDKEFECFKDPVNMIFGCCCPLCMVCDTAKRMNENIGAICCLAVCSMTAAITGMRTHTRAKYGIEGSLADDICMSCCCGACVNCQVNKELKARNPDKPGLFPI